MDVSNKRPLDDGYLPKYKPRRVSAVRDFPPGCGPNAVALKSNNSKENGGGEAGAVGAGTNKGRGRSDDDNVVNNAVDVDMTESLDALVGKITVNVNGSEKLVVIPEPHGIQLPDEAERSESLVGKITTMGGVSNDVDMTESLDALVGRVVVNANVNEKLVVIPEPLGIQLPNEAERSESLVEKITMGGVSNDGKSDSSSEKTGAGGQQMSRVLNEVARLALEKKSNTEAVPVEDKGISSSVKPKDKYRKRRVSAVRDFPPHCGRSVSLPTEEENLLITAGNGCVDAVKKVEVAPEELFLKIVPENGTIEGMSPTARRLLDEPAGEKEMIVYSTDINDKDGSVHSGLSSVREDNTLKKVDGGAGAEEMSQQKFSPLNSNAVAVDSLPETDGIPGSSTCGEEKYLDTYGDEGVPEITPISMAFPDTSDSDSDSAEPGLNDIVVYSTSKGGKKNISHSVFSPAGEVERKVVHALMAAPNCPWGLRKTVLSNPDAETSGVKSKNNSSRRLKGKAVAKKSIHTKVKISGSAYKKKLKKVHSRDPEQRPSALVLEDDEENLCEDPPRESTHSRTTPEFEINLPTIGRPNSSGDARDRVRDTLQVFNAICRKLLQHEEANSKPEEEGEKSKRKFRFDLDAANAIKQKGKEVNTGKPILGEVPGVEVGDEFQYRVELAIVGIHRLYQAGIDSMKHENGALVATSIVSSGAYMDDLENADVLVYSGQGGNVVGNKKQQPEDQKLEKGNLALKNSIDLKTPVRVVRGWKHKAVDPNNTRSKLVTTYVYDGLYTVQRYWTEIGPHGKQVFMFELRRNPNQPELAWKELKKSKKTKSREGVCVKDISGGKERIGICAVNTLDDEKPPSFNYTSDMIYPDWHNPVAPDGCDCIGRCSDSRKCKCAVKNDGEIPYNRNGALVETKLLVYECGPHCKCPPACYNRVSQRGIRYQLEIFKTESRGWGVRALTSIPSGSFICEYAGELLEDTEAEQRIGNDEYLFDIGQNLTDSSVKPKDQVISAELLEDGGYTIDACQYGNIGRFINHSCTPNLYAQNVIYNHRDMKMPHIMFFAMENIPPLQELTYHYNYSVNQIRDSDGNIKVKKCYCGTAECTGRLY